MSPEDYAARIGDTIGTSQWLEVTQDRIDAFAEATDDHQFIHVNPEAAKMTPFGGTIAHGFLTVSMLTKLAETAAIERIDGVKMGVNYGIDALRFVTPVKSGQRIRGVFVLKAFEQKAPGQFQQTLGVTVEIEGSERPAMVADWLSRIFV